MVNSPPSIQTIPSVPGSGEGAQAQAIDAQSAAHARALARLGFQGQMWGSDCRRIRAGCIGKTGAES